MSTINPLFLDSTKPIGDKVVTNVELTRILLMDGESLYFEVMDSFGFSQKFELREVITKKSSKFKAEVWLKYQLQIQYRFVIESAGQRLFVSAFGETRAGHSIEDTWDPCFESDPVVAKAEKSTARQTAFIKELKSTRDAKTKAPQESFHPQLFSQIKSLLDDLL